MVGDAASMQAPGQAPDQCSADRQEERGGCPAMAGVPLRRVASVQAAGKSIIRHRQGGTMAGDEIAEKGAQGSFISVRKSEIVAALMREPRLAEEGEAEKFRQLCRLLGALFHYEYFEELERLRDLYFQFNPQHSGKLDQVAADPAAYDELVASLTGVLKKANFIEVGADEIERASRERALAPVEVRTPVEDYSDIRFFRRGRHPETVEVAEWYGLRKRQAGFDVYDDVVLIAAVKPLTALSSIEQRKRLGKRKLLRGAVLIKYFRDIASADLNTLLPDVRVIMSARDKWLLGLPALFGGIPLLLKLVPTLAVLFVLLGIQLGFGGSTDGSRLGQALAVTSGVIALGSFVIHQWLKYQRQALRYQLEINDAIYFRNLHNNAGIFDAVIGAAEDQECKEAFLAYFFLHGESMTEPALDARIEGWLKARFGLDVDFEVTDGVAKLERLELLTRTGESLSVVPLDAGLRCLDRRWDAFFGFNAPAAGDGASARFIGHRVAAGQGSAGVSPGRTAK